MKLHELAHARSGDKGNTADITIFAYEPVNYPLLEKEVTIARVRAHFGSMAQGKIERFCVPHLHAIKFVLHGALAGGVTRSLALDAHGKCFSSVLLELEIENGGSR
jgi:hypothetical protein